MIDSESTIDSTWICSDGSVKRGVSRGGGGALVIIRSVERREIRVAAGSLLSSTRAALMAIRTALEEVSTVAGDLATGPAVVLYTDSQAALATVAGAANQGPRQLGRVRLSGPCYAASQKQDSESRSSGCQPIVAYREMNAETSWQGKLPACRRKYPLIRVR